MHKGRICDGLQVAVVHVERLDPAQVHEGRVRDPAAPIMIAVCSRARASPRICTKSESTIGSRRHPDTLTAHAAGKTARHASRLPMIIDSASIHGKSMAASQNSMQTPRSAFDSRIVKNPRKPSPIERVPARCTYIGTALARQAALDYHGGPKARLRWLRP